MPKNAMQTQNFDIPGPVLFTPKLHRDDRGFFAETLRQSHLAEVLEESPSFAQENLSHSVNRGTIRGLHFQAPPKAQAKLIQCMSGRILDIAVDLRPSSAHYGQHIRAELGADSASSLWIPAGFAHGFITLTDNVRVAYKVTDYYSPDHERTLHWADPDLAIEWGVPHADAILSDKDRDGESFDGFDNPFT